MQHIFFRPKKKILMSQHFPPHPELSQLNLHALNQGFWMGIENYDWHKLEMYLLYKWKQKDFMGKEFCARNLDSESCFTYSNWISLYFQAMCSATCLSCLTSRSTSHRMLISHKFLFLIPPIPKSLIITY